jgi:hypothetical protein
LSAFTFNGCALDENAMHLPFAQGPAQQTAARADEERHLGAGRCRPTAAVERMALMASGHVRYSLKTPYRDGTTHIVLEPLDLMGRLAALVPLPRMHLTRFHGVLAPHSKWRTAVTPAHRGVGSPEAPMCPGEQERPLVPPHVALNWARRLKRVFGVELEACARCGGKLKIIASIEQPELIAKILSHLERAVPGQYQAELPLGARAPPPQARLL